MTSGSLQGVTLLISRKKRKQALQEIHNPTQSFTYFPTHTYPDVLLVIPTDTSTEQTVNIEMCSVVNGSLTDPFTSESFYQDYFNDKL